MKSKDSPWQSILINKLNPLAQMVELEYIQIRRCALPQTLFGNPEDWEKPPKRLRKIGFRLFVPVVLLIILGVAVLGVSLRWW